MLEVTETSVEVTETTTEETETESIITETAIETSVSDDVTDISIPNIEESNSISYHDIDLFVPGVGACEGTISDEYSSEILTSINDLKTLQEHQVNLLQLLFCILCILIGAVCGLLLTLHIKRR